jgi:hypothetical protein
MADERVIRDGFFSKIYFSSAKELARLILDVLTSLQIKFDIDSRRVPIRDRRASAEKKSFFCVHCLAEIYETVNDSDPKMVSVELVKPLKIRDDGFYQDLWIEIRSASE